MLELIELTKFKFGVLDPSDEYSDEYAPDPLQTRVCFSPAFEKLFCLPFSLWFFSARSLPLLLSDSGVQVKG